MKYYICQMFALLLLTISCENETDVAQEMENFDKVFVPVWCFTHIENLEEAATHALALEQQWYFLKSEYGDLANLEIDWANTYHCINELLTSALQNIEYRDLKAAAEDLNAFRFELIQLRQRHDIDYLLDYVWEFQMIYDLMKVLTNEQYYYCETYEFDCLIEELNYTWNDLLKAENNQFWTDTTQQAWRKWRIEISLLLSQYTAVMDQVNINETLAEQYINDIEPILLNMIQLFGKFDKGAEIQVANI